MHKVDIVPYKEMFDDLESMLLDEEDYEQTMEMLKLNNDEEMIFKRARFHIKRKEPNSSVIKKAYQIFMAKSFHNKNLDSGDSQNILGKDGEKDNIVKMIYTLIKSNIEYILIAFLIAFVIKKLI